MSTLDQATAGKHKPDFVFDDRSAAVMLENFRRYVQAIPFSDGSENWEAVFFPHGEADLARLAALFDGTQPPDGKLPPQQALLLAFMRMMETPRKLFNDLPNAHRNLYYRKLLGMAEREAQPDHAVLSFVLDKDVSELMLPKGSLFDGGIDSAGNALQYQLEQDVLVNGGRLASLCWSVPGATGHRKVAYDVDAGIAWPEAGARLWTSDESPLSVRAGRAFSSPALDVRHGEVSIVATTAGGDLVSAARVSTTDGWLDLVPTTTSTDVTLQCKGDQLAAPAGLDGYADATPVVELCASAAVANITALTVTCDRVTDILYATDDGNAQMDARGTPFTAAPRLDSTIYLASRDWLGKTKVTVTLKPEWLGLPQTSFAEWYKGYTSAPTNNSDFKVSLNLMVDGASTGDPSTVSLFASGSGTTSPAGNDLVHVIDGPIGGTWNNDSTDPRDQPVYLAISLTRDFGHKSWESSTSLANPPYTPEWKRLVVKYAIVDAPVKAAYALTGFGHQSAGAAADPDATKRQLYLGFDKITPGQDLHLHWHLQGPAPLALDWQYLDKSNQWKSLADQVRDETDGLFDTGLWHAVLPMDAGWNQPAMPAGRYWVRAVEAPAALAAEPTTAATYPLLFAIHANAGSAVLANPATVDAGHFSAGLPADTISQAVERLPGLREVKQPLPTRGGRARETEAEFLQRAAQRLSHRNRAITWRDIRTLLMDKFPEIGHLRVPDDVRRRDAREIQRIVVLPRAGEADNIDVLRPVFSPARRKRMFTYLEGISSVWLTMYLEIIDPVYTDVIVEWDVVFNPGVNAEYGERQLREAVTRQYMSWAGGDVAAPILAGTVAFYDLIGFIQGQDHVHHVAGLKLNGGTAPVAMGPNEVAVLVMPPSTREAP